MGLLAYVPKKGTRLIWVNQFNNNRAQVVDSIYYMALKLLRKKISFWREMIIILPKVNVIMLWGHSIFLCTWFFNATSDWITKFVTVYPGIYCRK